MINALKHAFPEQGKGAIIFEYRSKGKEWKLSVTDDGIGMPKENAKPGLGTGIVNALATQLHGRIAIADAAPGAAFTLEHKEADDTEMPTSSAA